MGLMHVVVPALSVICIYSIIIIIYSYHIDKKNWNGGRCECGSEWEIVPDIKEGYTTVYECPECGNIIWVTTDVAKKK